MFQEMLTYPFILCNQNLSYEVLSGLGRPIHSLSSEHLYLQICDGRTPQLHKCWEHRWNCRLGAELNVWLFSSGLDNRRLGSLWPPGSGRMATAPRLEPQLQEEAISVSQARFLCQGERHLYSAHLPLPADSAWLGLAQGSILYLLIFTTYFQQFTSKFWVS